MHGITGRFGYMKYRPPRPGRLLAAMEWDSKGWRATGSGASWGGGIGKGYGPWRDAWGSRHCEGGAWDDTWSGEAWDGDRGGGDWDSTCGDQWFGNPPWGTGRGSRNKKDKSYHNCTYLGCGRHRLPHEDRCSLASLILELIHDDTGVQIPSMSVAAWKEKACNAFFYLLANTQPSTRIQHMVPRGQKFTLEAAAESMIQMWKVLVNDPAERIGQAVQFLQWCVEDQNKMVKEAVHKGMEDDAEVIPRAPVPGSGATPHNAETRPLVRSDTHEELERVKKALGEMQQNIAAGHWRAEEAEEQKSQAEAKEEKIFERQALQQRVMKSAGGQQPTPAPAAAGIADFAAILGSAAPHFQEGSRSSGSIAGIAPAHAPVSGMPQPQAYATAASLVSPKATAEELAAKVKQRRERLVMLQGEVAARRDSQEAAKKAQNAKKIPAVHAAEEMRPVRDAQENEHASARAKAEPDACVIRTAEEIIAARHAPREVAAQEDLTARGTEEAAAEQARFNAEVEILAVLAEEVVAKKARPENNAAVTAAAQRSAPPAMHGEVAGGSGPDG